MTWTCAGEEADAGAFAPFDPVEVLADYDGPRLFTVRNAAGQLRLAHWLDEDAAHARFAVEPVEPVELHALRNGTVAVRTVLDRPTLVVVDVSHRGQVASARHASLAALPPDVLPAPDETLTRAVAGRSEPAKSAGRSPIDVPAAAP